MTVVYKVLPVGVQLWKVLSYVEKEILFLFGRGNVYYSLRAGGASFTFFLCWNFHLFLRILWKQILESYFLICKSSLNAFL